MHMPRNPSLNGFQLVCGLTPTSTTSQVRAMSSDGFHVMVAGFAVVEEGAKEGKGTVDEALTNLWVESWVPKTMKPTAPPGLSCDCAVMVGFGTEAVQIAYGGVEMHTPKSAKFPRARFSRCDKATPHAGFPFAGAELLTAARDLFIKEKEQQKQEREHEERVCKTNNISATAHVR